MFPYTFFSSRSLSKFDKHILNFKTSITMSAVLQPKVTTEIPGPRSKAEAEKLGSFFDNRAFYFVADYEKSSGN